MIDRETSSSLKYLFIGEACDFIQFLEEDENFYSKLLKEKHNDGK